MIVVYITCANKKEADSIAKLLLGKRLIACANIFSARSIYRWAGRIMNGKEFVLLAKSAASKYSAIKKVIGKAHSYDVPCILKIDAVVNGDYKKWVLKQIK